MSSAAPAAATGTVDGAVLEDRIVLRSLPAAVARRRRLSLAAAAAAAGVAAGLLALRTLDAPAGDRLVAGMLVAAALTALAANWSTCGLSVASVVAAPKGEGPGRSTPLGRLGFHALGSVPVAAATGAALGALGSLAVADRVPAGVLLGAWAVAAVAYGLHELGLVSMPTPMRRRQLPRHWRRTMSPRRVAFLFGAIIGPGFLIFIRSSAWYLVAAGVVAAGSPALGAGAFAAIAVGRCGPSLVAIVHQRRGGTMANLLETCLRIDRHVQVATGAVLVAVGVAVAAGGVG